MTLFNKDAVRNAINHHALAIAQYYANGAQVTYHKHEVRLGNKGARVYDTRKGLYNDFEAGTGGDGFSFVQALTGCNFAEVAHIVAAFAGSNYSQPKSIVKAANKVVDNNLCAKAMQIWNEAKPLQNGDVVMNYLQKRAITLTTAQINNVRFHSALYHPTTKLKHYAMVALYRDVQGNPQAIHRTYLTLSGEKLQGEGINPKLMLAPSKGCALRLSPIAATIGLTEGIENALSVTLMTGFSCWAVGSASGLSNVQLPDAIREVMIFRDNDQAGIEASEKACNRFAQQGLKARIISPQGCNDFNELLMQKHSIL
jgi:putative DNA primase/helicase